MQLKEKLKTLLTEAKAAFEETETSIDAITVELTDSPQAGSNSETKITIRIYSRSNLEV